MKRKSLLLLLVPVLFFAGCSQIDYNHPLDSQVPSENENFFKDDDGDGVANLWDPDHELYKSLLDTIAPVITLDGPDTIRVQQGSPQTVFDEWKKKYTVKDLKDPDPYDTVIIDFSTDFVQTVSIQYYASDKAGNDTKVLRWVVIFAKPTVDTIDPQIYVANNMVNIEILKGESFDPRKNVTAFDETDTGLTKKITIDGEVNADKPDVYTLTYKVSDNSGNTATLVRKITVSETIGPDDDYPVITLIGPKTMHISLTEKFEDPGYTAYDTTDKDISTKVVVKGEVKAAPGTYYINYTVTDNSLHTGTEMRTVIRHPGESIGDTSPPVIELFNKRDTLITLTKGTEFKIPDLQVKDNLDAIPKDSVTAHHSININATGTYPVTLLVYDKARNEGKLIITVKVVDGTKDNEPPEITLKGKNPDTVGVSATATYAYRDSATAHDNKDGNITAKITIKGTVDRTKEGTTTITYIVKDAAGLADTAKRIVVVKQDVKPDLLETYKVPATAALANMTKTYKSAEIVGDATKAPNLSTMTEFRIDWSNKTLNSLSINMPNPVNYIDLKAVATHTLDQKEPTIKFTGVTKISKFDGEYYVTVDGNNFVMVQIDGDFAIIMKP